MKLKTVAAHRPGRVSSADQDRLIAAFEERVLRDRADEIEEARFIGKEIFASGARGVWSVVILNIATPVLLFGFSKNVLEKNPDTLVVSSYLFLFGFFLSIGGYLYFQRIFTSTSVELRDRARSLDLVLQNFFKSSPSERLEILDNYKFEQVGPSREDKKNMLFSSILLCGALLFWAFGVHNVLHTYERSAVSPINPSVSSTILPKATQPKMNQPSKKAREENDR